MLDEEGREMAAETGRGKRGGEETVGEVNGVGEMAEGNGDQEEEEEQQEEEEEEETRREVEGGGAGRSTRDWWNWGYVSKGGAVRRTKGTRKRWRWGGTRHRMMRKALKNAYNGLVCKCVYVRVFVSTYLYVCE